MNQESIPPVTILLYHDILPPGGVSEDKGSIASDRLREHIRALQGSGIEMVSLDSAFAAMVTEETGGGPMRCAITFDDAMTGVYRFLPGLLPDLAAMPTVFVLTGYVGGKNLWNTRTPVIAEHMNLDMLLDLRRQGVDLQFLGTDHHNLCKFSEGELEVRFGEGRAWFEEKLGTTPRYLSYPYGAYIAATVKVVSRCFQGAFSVNHGSWWGPEARWGANRISVPSYLSGQDLVEILSIPPSRRWVEMERRAPWWRPLAG